MSLHLSTTSNSIHSNPLPEQADSFLSTTEITVASLTERPQSILNITPNYFEHLSSREFLITTCAAIATAFTVAYFATPFIQPSSTSSVYNLTHSQQVPPLPDVLNQSTMNLSSAAYSFFNQSLPICPLEPKATPLPASNATQNHSFSLNQTSFLSNTSNQTSTKPLFSPSTPETKPAAATTENLTEAIEPPAAINATSNEAQVLTGKELQHPVEQLLDNTIHNIKNSLSEKDRASEKQIEGIIRDIFRAPTHYSSWSSNIIHTTYVVKLLANLKEEAVCDKLQEFLGSTITHEKLTNPSVKELFKQYIQAEVPSQQKQIQFLTKAFLQEASTNCKTNWFQ